VPEPAGPASPASTGRRRWVIALYALLVLGIGTLASLLLARSVKRVTFRPGRLRDVLTGRAAGSYRRSRKPQPGR